MKSNYVWIIFAVIFFSLALFHFSQAELKISHFKNKGTIKTINGMPTGVGEFVTDFNEYIDQVNQNNKKSNVLAAVGYIVAALTAIFSFSLASHPKP